MIPAHVALYSALSPAQSALLAAQLLRHGLIAPEAVAAATGDDLASLDGPRLASVCSGLSHAQVVLTLARETSPLALETIDVLLRKPMYLCARGETGEQLTDIEGRPLPLPLGHRRGEPPGRAAEQVVRRRARDPRTTLPRDPRVIVRLAPNPKKPGSAAHERYSLYTLGMSVAEARVLGVRHSDIQWDLRHGHISVCLPQDVTPSPRSAAEALASLQDA